MVPIVVHHHKKRTRWAICEKWNTIESTYNWHNNGFVNVLTEFAGILKPAPCIISKIKRRHRSYQQDTAKNSTEKTKKKKKTKIRPHWNCYSSKVYSLLWLDLAHRYELIELRLELGRFGMRMKRKKMCSLRKTKKVNLNFSYPVFQISIARNPFYYLSVDESSPNCAEPQSFSIWARWRCASRYSALCQKTHHNCNSPQPKLMRLLFEDPPAPSRYVWATSVLRSHQFVCNPCKFV